MISNVVLAREPHESKIPDTTFKSMGMHIYHAMKIREGSCRSALSRSSLPGLDYSLNPYRGCQHECIYCYSPEVLREERPWGSFVDVRRNIPMVLAKELRRKEKGVVGLGTVTDAYQPIEKRFGITGMCLEQLLKRDFPITIQTKSPLVLRDLDIIKRFSNKAVGTSISTLDEDYSRLFEPHASPPLERLKALSEFTRGGVETWVFIGPILPGVTDEDLEGLVKAIADSGTRRVLTDKLRLRGRIWDRITDKVESRDLRLKGFREMAKGTAQFGKIENRIKELCDIHDLEWETAFPSSKSRLDWFRG